MDQPPELTSGIIKYYFWFPFLKMYMYQIYYMYVLFKYCFNVVRNEDFLETVPNAKLRRVKWVPMFDCLKQGILDEMVQEISNMWEFESMPHKLEILEKQKEKFAEKNPENTAWRPQHIDVKNQLRASDIANLLRQRTLLESLANEYEGRANRLKNAVAAKRGYLKALQMDIQKYHNKNQDIVSKIHDKIYDHQRLSEIMIPNMVKGDDFKWTEKELQIKHKIIRHLNTE